jgi:replicative DNA helicase
VIRSVVAARRHEVIAGTAERTTDGTPWVVVWAEEALVSGAMLSAWQDVRDVMVEFNLEGHEFQIRDMGEIWDALTIVALRGHETTAVTVGAELEDLGTLDEVGGYDNIQRIVGAWDIYGGLAPMQAHAAVVKNAAQKRLRMRELSREANALGEPTGAFLTRYAGEL